MSPAATDGAGRTQPPLLSRQRLGDYGLSFLLALMATARCYAAAQAGRDGDRLLAAHGAAVAIALGVSAFLPLLRGAPLAARSGGDRARSRRSATSRSCRLARCPWRGNRTGC
ncbi:MAG TPA: hypothetical protein VKB09_05655 [Thermomicrobiales bacterium]|nr:hypothetical protein [Thermomicrobiales bacterium]